MTSGKFRRALQIRVPDALASRRGFLRLDAGAPSDRSRRRRLRAHALQRDGLRRATHDDTRRDARALPHRPVRRHAHQRGHRTRARPRRHPRPRLRPVRDLGRVGDRRRSSSGRCSPGSVRPAGSTTPTYRSSPRRGKATRPRCSRACARRPACCCTSQPWELRAPRPRHDLQAGSLTVRPDSWNIALLVHVLGAVILIGGLMTASAAAIAGWSDEAVTLRRLSYRSLLIVASPATSSCASARMGRIERRPGQGHKHADLARDRLHHR